MTTDYEIVFRGTNDPLRFSLKDGEFNARLGVNSWTFSDDENSYTVASDAILYFVAKIKESEDPEDKS